MSSVVVIVPPPLADGFRLAGARVRTADNAMQALELARESLTDPDAGLVALADVWYEALDAGTRRLLDRSSRPVVLPIPTRAEVSPAERRRTQLQEIIRRAIGLRIVLSNNGSARS